MFTENMHLHLSDQDMQTLREFKEITKSFSSLIKENREYFSWQSIAAIAGFVLGEIFCMKLLKKVDSIPSKTERRIIRATLRGRYTEAELVRVKYYPPSHDEGRHRQYNYSYYGDYTYMVDGRTYRCRKGFHSQPPKTLTLYYPGRSGRTYHRNQLCFEPLRYAVFILLIVMPFLAGAAALYILGGVPE